MIALDTETHLIRPALQAPPLVCLSWARGGAEPRPGDSIGLLLACDVRQFLAEDARAAEGEPWILHESCFDLGVMVESGALTIAQVFDLLDRGLVHDTLIREKLLDIATGQKFYKDSSGKSAKRKYDLGSLVRKYFGVELDKGAKPIKVRGADGVSRDVADPNDTSPGRWRLRYSELDGVPLAEWPNDAKDYATDDAKWTLAVYHEQEKRRDRVAAQLGGDPLEDEPRQVRRLWALYLMRSWGIRTNPEHIADLDRRTREALDAVKGDLQAVGLVRENGTRDTKAAKARMLRVCEENQTPIEITATGEKKIKAGELDHAGAVAAGYVALDADTCKRSGDLALQHYCEINSHQLVLSRDCKRFRDGTTLPIHTRINSLVDTGRPSSSDPNLFNVRNLPGIRECFVSRPGTWFLDADISGLELATLAQVLLKWIGWSSMADAILKHGSAGVLHTLLAARLLGISEAEAFRREALGKKLDLEFYNARQTAKAANFGFPGGLGIESLIYFARSKYKVFLTIERAKELKREWLAMWPEMKEYFALISEWCSNSNDGRCTIKQLFSNRFRGACFYTQACNGPFQALGADGTGHMIYELQRACYVEGVDARLFGSRIVNYVYDQVVVEVPANVERANLAADAVIEIGERECNHFLPDVPIKMGTPTLSKKWSKDAVPVRDDRGRLVLWEN